MEFVWYLEAVQGMEKNQGVGYPIYAESPVIPYTYYFL